MESWWDGSILNIYKQQNKKIRMYVITEINTITRFGFEACLWRALSSKGAMGIEKHYTEIVWRCLVNVKRLMHS